MEMHHHDDIDAEPQLGVQVVHDRDTVYLVNHVAGSLEQSPLEPKWSRRDNLMALMRRHYISKHNDGPETVLASQEQLILCPIPFLNNSIEHSERKFVLSEYVPKQAQ
jgi:hypothetical protein